MARTRKWVGAGTRTAAAVLAPAIMASTLVVSATPSFAGTPTRIGGIHSNYQCDASDQWIQTASAGPSFVVPTGATKLTKWSTGGGALAGTMQFEVWAPAGGNDFTLVYISQPTTLSVGETTRIVLPTAVTVAAGDVIGYRAVTVTDCAFRTNLSGDSYLYDPGSSTPTVGSTVSFLGPATGFRFNVAALVH